MVENHGQLLEERIWTFNGDPACIRAMLEALREWLSQAGVTADTSGTIELVTAEVLNNIAEHAYQDAGGDITADIKIFDGYLQAALIDQGRPMPNATLPPARYVDPDLALEDLPEGGFGWGLIRTLCSDVNYRRDGLKNHTVLTIPLDERNSK